MSSILLFFILIYFVLFDVEMLDVDVLYIFVLVVCCHYFADHIGKSELLFANTKNDLSTLDRGIF